MNKKKSQTILCESRTLQCIPAEYLAKIETTAEKLLEYGSNAAESWDVMFEKPGVLATRKTGNSRAICVRGETLMPYTIPEIYAMTSTSKGRKSLDSQLEIYNRLKWFSRNTGVEYLRFKPVWPTAARDFCNLTHWRLLDDGTFLTFGYSTPFPDLCPEEDGVVRADLILGGYVMRPVVGGTQIFIVVQSDLGGSLPTRVANMAAEQQPNSLLKLRKRLDEKYSFANERPDFSKPILPTFEGFCYIVLTELYHK